MCELNKDKAWYIDKVYMPKLFENQYVVIYLAFNGATGKSSVGRCMQDNKVLADIAYKALLAQQKSKTK